MNEEAKRAVKNRDIVSDKVKPTAISERFVFIKASAKDTSSDIKKTLEALELMGQSGWKLVSYQFNKKDSGFLLERAP